VASTIAVQDVNAKPRIPQKDQKTERNVKYLPTKKKKPTVPDPDEPVAPLVLPPPDPLPPPPSEGCIKDQKKC
jgi:hypothetical protein